MSKPTIKKVTRSSLFSVASDLEMNTHYLDSMLNVCREQIAEVGGEMTRDEILIACESATILLSALDQYMRKIKKSGDALYKQAWLLPLGEGAE